MIASYLACSGVVGCCVGGVFLLARMPVSCGFAFGAACTLILQSFIVQVST